MVHTPMGSRAPHSCTAVAVVMMMIMRIAVFTLRDTYGRGQQFTYKKSQPTRHRFAVNHGSVQRGLAWTPNPRGVFQVHMYTHDKSKRPRLAAMCTHYSRLRGRTDLVALVFCVCYIHMCTRSFFSWCCGLIWMGQLRCGSIEWVEATRSRRIDYAVS